MNMQHKKGAFEEKSEEYWKASKKRKGVILSSLEEVTGLKRKACIKRLRKLQSEDPGSQEQRGRPRYYTPDVIAALLEIWEMGSEACGENLHSQINKYIDIQIREKEWKHDELITFKLRKMSEGSVKKYVGNFTRTRRNFGGKGTTQRSSIVSMVPIRMDGWGTAEAGVTQVDTVAHCGHTTADDYVFTTNGTDVATLWGTRRAQWCKGQEVTRASLEAMRNDSPFPWTEIHPDSGMEFINAHCIAYANGTNLRMTRSRPYHKNDNCFVEERNGSRWKVTREKIAKTPYERVLERKDVSEEVKEKLRKEHGLLNPATMKAAIDRLSKRVHDIQRKHGKPKKSPGKV